MRKEGTMRRNLRPEDVARLLAAPKCATLATYRRDGTVLLSPVWHEWRDGGFNIWTGGVSEGKVRHLERDPRASLVVAEQAMPYRGLDASGRATLSLDGFHDVVRRTAARYMSPQEADAFAAEYPEPRTVIRLVPDRIRAWDFKDDAAAAGKA